MRQKCFCPVDDCLFSWFCFLQETSREIQDCNAEIANLASSVIGSMRTVRSCKAEAQEQRRYEQALNNKLQLLKRKGIYSAVHLLIRRVKHPIHYHMTLIVPIGL